MYSLQFIVKNKVFSFYVGTVLLIAFLFFGCFAIGKPVADADEKIVEGTVSIISGNEEFETYKSWSHGSHTDKDGKTVASDAIQMPAREIEDKLTLIAYADDFEIKISGNPKWVNYMIYTENFGTYEESSYLNDNLEIPKAKGIYI